MSDGLLGIGALPIGASATGVAPVPPRGGAMPSAKAQTVAEDFEAMFLNSMFSQMMTGMEGEGPFGGSQATGVWRSFLTNEYSKTFAKAGGIGLAKHVYGALLAQQEARSP